MDLSKAYECILHDLLITKLEAYWLEHNVLDYLSVWKQRTEMVPAPVAGAIKFVHCHKDQLQMLCY